MNNLIKLDIFKEYEVQVKEIHDRLRRLSDDDPYLTSTKSELAEVYAQMGHLFYQHNNFDKAEECYKKALNYNAHHLQALNQMGLVLSHQELYQLAIDYFEQIVSLANERHNLEHKVDALLSMSLIYIKENKLNKAYKKVYEAENLTPIYYLSDGLKERIKRINEQIQTFKEKIEKLREVENLLKNVDALISRKNWDEAKKTLQKAKGISPSHPAISRSEEKLRDSISAHSLVRLENAGLFNKPEVIYEQQETDRFSFDL